jgi:DNA (cytosine-5)-methyltransferase 1
VTSRTKTFNVVDLFCGTGAISYGLRSFDRRFKVLGGIDFDAKACATASANHFGANFLSEPIETISPKTFAGHIGGGRVDAIVGGPPCQGFSSLRPNRQSEISDPRNSLYRNFAEYVKYFEPTVFVMENVIGLVNDSDGRLLRQILARFSKLGYQLDWRVLNAANYGVPQKRERFVLFGVNKARVKRPTIEYPKPTHFFEGRVIGTRFKENYITNQTSGVPATTAYEAISDLPPLTNGEEKSFYSSAPKNPYQKERRENAPSSLSLHQAANHSSKMLKVMKHAGANKDALPFGMVSSGYSSCYSRLEKNEPATTITVKFTSPASSKCIHPTQDRAITPREAARLQGFDDSFTFCGSKTDIAYQIGNAVPPLLGKVLAPMLVENLEAARYA